MPWKLLNPARPVGLLLLGSLLLPGLPAADFYACFTKIDSGEDFERVSRTGAEADIVVHIGEVEGRLVFWRGTSYLPYWETERGRWSLPELVRREGDGTAKRPDRVNTFSHVHVVEQVAERILVLWRYLPCFGGGNPHTGVTPTSFVEETFEIRPDGRVRRTLRRGTPRYDEWTDPLNRTVQDLRLDPEGVHEVSCTDPRRSPPQPPVEGNPVKADGAAAPSLAWRFDDGRGNETRESVTATLRPLEGAGTLWRRGVSGTALLFDGYTTETGLPAEKAPKLEGGITLSGWIALGAYPWNWAPIIQQGDDAGYFLGVDGHGHPGFKVQAGSRWEELVSEERIARSRWVHVAGAYDAESGAMTLFVDGSPVKRRVVGPGPVRVPPDPIRIGKGKPRRPVDPVRRNTFEAEYGFDGLIDEVRVYDQALEPATIRALYEQLRPDEPSRPDMEHRLLPEAETTGRFGARYTHLEYYPSWDVLWRFGDYPDVVVSFDASPSRFVFWRGPGYIPMLVNDREQWYSNEFNETWGRSGGRGCQEPMSDKEAYTNHARIIENTPARVVVHWRYPLKDVLHVYANWSQETGWADWSDWYFTIYPDGVAAKRMRLWTDGPRNHEWHEGMAILGPNQHPEQVLETEKALILADIEGNATAYSWKDGPPRGVDYGGKKIHIVNFKSDYDPFTIGDFRGGNVYSGEVTDYSVFPNWNHWPAAQMPSDGRYASFPDRMSHSSLTHVRLPDYRAAHGDRPFQEKILLEGMSSESPRRLSVLARSWLQAPELLVDAGCRSFGYEPAERAYPLVATAESLSFRIDASDERPLYNPCFSVLDWGSHAEVVVEVDGEPREAGDDLRQGVVRDRGGRLQLLVWLRMEATRPAKFQLAGARPTLARDELGGLRWAERPAPGADPWSVALEVGALQGAPCAQYIFEWSAEIDGAVDDSGWLNSPRFRVRGLLPETTYRFRVKARDRYLRESGWLEADPLRTPEPPPPHVWKLDEGSGREAAESTGEHPARVRGTASWVEGRLGGAIQLDGSSWLEISSAGKIATRTGFTWCAWIRTEEESGPIFARAGRAKWETGGKVLFVDGGRLAFDAGWVGEVSARGAPVSDGGWHHVAVTVGVEEAGTRVAFYVDGRPAGGGMLDVGRNLEDGLPLRIGYCNTNFPGDGSGFTGEIDDVRHYGHVLTAKAIREIHAHASR